MRKRIYAAFALAVLILVGAAYFLPRFTTSPKTIAPAAKFIILKTNYCMVKMPGEKSAAFHDRFTAYAAGLMANFESVTIEFYFNEDGQEEAIVIAEKKIWK